MGGEGETFALRRDSYRPPYLAALKIELAADYRGRNRVGFGGGGGAEREREREKSGEKERVPPRDVPRKSETPPRYPVLLPVSMLRHRISISIRSTGRIGLGGQAADKPAWFVAEPANKRIH